jgi:ribonuclease HI
LDPIKNNYAKFYALDTLLKFVVDKNVYQLQMFGDSALVINGIKDVTTL